VVCAVASLKALKTFSGGALMTLCSVTLLSDIKINFVVHEYFQYKDGQSNKNLYCADATFSGAFPPHRRVHHRPAKIGNMPFERRFKIIKLSCSFLSLYFDHHAQDYPVH
jgi:hypothetical protein